MEIMYRTLQPEEKGFLSEMLYVAIYVPEGTKPLPKSIIQTPELSKYTDGWGRRGDAAVVAVLDNILIGCAWIRLFRESNKGYGYVDENTPELSMAVLPQFRNRGIGHHLLNRLLDIAFEFGFSSVSLSVDKQNRAVNFYKKEGFHIIKKEETAFTMVRKI